MSAHFPGPESSASELKDLRADSRVAAAAGALCRRLGLGNATLFAAGSLPVFAAGDAHVRCELLRGHGVERNASTTDAIATGASH